MAKKKKRARRTKAQMAEARAKQVKAPKKTRKTKADKKVMKPLVVENDLVQAEWKESIEPVQKNGRKRRRTKLEMQAAKLAIHDSDWDAVKNKPKKARRPKLKEKEAPPVNGFEDAVFTVKDRPKLSVEDLRVYLREKYTPNAGLRSPDYILQLCDIVEHMEIENSLLKKQLKGDK